MVWSNSDLHNPCLHKCFSRRFLMIFLYIYLSKYSTTQWFHPTYIISIKTYDFSSLYTTIAHCKLSRVFDIIDCCFFNKTGSRKFTYPDIGHIQNYFVKKHSDCIHKYSEDDIKKLRFWLTPSMYVWKIGSSNIRLEFQFATIARHWQLVCLYMYSKTYNV